MKTVRLWFRKTGAAKYISHLDLTRCMARAVHRSELPVWYSKGFNPRASLVFALPLSLGVCSENESVDIKLEDEEIPFDEIVERMNRDLPPDLAVYEAAEPEMKPGKIAWAGFEVFAHAPGEEAKSVEEGYRSLLREPALIVPRHTKRGMADFDVRPYLDRMELGPAPGGVLLRLTLPAGSESNVNPRLLLDAAEKYRGLAPYVEIRRTGLFDADFKKFR